MRALTGSPWRSFNSTTLRFADEIAGEIARRDAEELLDEAAEEVRPAPRSWFYRPYLTLDLLDHPDAERIRATVEMVARGVAALVARSVAHGLTAPDEED